MIETGSTLERLAQLVVSLVSIGEVRGSSLALSTTKNLSHTICFTVCFRMFVCLCVLEYLFEVMLECSHTNTSRASNIRTHTHANKEKSRAKCAEGRI